MRRSSKACRIRVLAHKIKMAEKRQDRAERGNRPGAWKDPHPSPVFRGKETWKDDKLYFRRRQRRMRRFGHG